MSTIGFIGGLHDLEGTPEQIAARKRERLAALMLQWTRARRWREYQPGELGRRGPYFVTSAGMLLELVRVPVLTSTGDGIVALNEGEVAGWFEEAGQPVFLREGTPASVEELDALEERREAKKQAARQAQIRADQRLAGEPKIAVTLGAMEGRPLPTVSQAAAAILDAHGTITERMGRLEFQLPQSRAAYPALLDAVRVLAAAREIVLGCLASQSKRTLAERLPDVQVAADGGLVA